MFWVILILIVIVIAVRFVLKEKNSASEANAIAQEHKAVSWREPRTPKEWLALLAIMSDGLAGGGDDVFWSVTIDYITDIVSIDVFGLDNRQSYNETEPWKFLSSNAGGVIGSPYRCVSYSMNFHGVEGTIPGFMRDKEGWLEYLGKYSSYVEIRNWKYSTVHQLAETCYIFFVGHTGDYNRNHSNVTELIMREFD